MSYKQGQNFHALIATHWKKPFKTSVTANKNKLLEGTTTAQCAAIKARQLFPYGGDAAHRTTLSI
jgi:hypothetical protein